MVRFISTNRECLCKCNECTSADRLVISDMFETFNSFDFDLDYLSANMIGFDKRIFIIEYRMISFLFINPVILKAEGEFTTSQECIYHKALRTVKRYKSIDVSFLDSNFEEREMHLEDEFALKFQHMMDHIDGHQI